MWFQKNLSAFACISYVRFQQSRSLSSGLFQSDRQISPDIHLNGYASTFKLVHFSVCCSFPGIRLFVFLCSWWLMSWRLLRPSEREKDRERERWREKGIEGWRSLFVIGNVLRKSLARYHMAMERHSYMSTLLCSPCPFDLSVSLALICAFNLHSNSMWSDLQCENVSVSCLSSPLLTTSVYYCYVRWAGE